MIDQVFPNIYRMEIPLPGNPLKAINSYVIKDGKRYLIIDTGMNRPECFQAMQAGLAELKVDLEQTDFFITHLHADHLGLVSELARPSGRIYFNHPDAHVFQDPHHWDEVITTAKANGFPEEEIQGAMQRHPGRRFTAQPTLHFTLLKEGDRIPFADYVFHCVETPGHTRGHLCLYEPRTKIFFSGDHLLENITSNISWWAENEDPLKHYLHNLDKIDRYDISWVFPGHRVAFQHYRRRIAELKYHHEVRADEVLSILKKGKQNAYQVASQMSWDIDCRRWEDFPVPQKWFASGEALSHLQYLQGKSKVRREAVNGKASFSLAGER